MGFSLNPFRKVATVSEEPVDEVGPFAPHAFGFYQGTSTEGSSDLTRYLRFTSNGTVFEVVDVGSAEMAWALLNDWVCTNQTTGRENVLGHGDYTSVGTFLIARRFERPVVYTVLDSEPAGFRARCTDTAQGTSSCYDFTWLDPDGEISPPTS